MLVVSVSDLKLRLSSWNGVVPNMLLGPPTNSKINNKIKRFLVGTYSFNSTYNTVCNVVYGGYTIKEDEIKLNNCNRPRMSVS